MNDIVIYDPNAIEDYAVMIFIGSVVDESLKSIPLTEMKWNCKNGYLYLTLEEIYEQISAKIDEIITVVVERPADGSIYQCGNSGQGVWVQHGTTRGYA